MLLIWYPTNSINQSINYCITICLYRQGTKVCKWHVSFRNRKNKTIHHTSYPSPSSRFDTPKSPSLTIESFIKILSGFISRCVTFCSCMNSTACATWLRMNTAWNQINTHIKWSNLAKGQEKENLERINDWKERITQNNNLYMHMICQTYLQEYMLYRLTSSSGMPSRQTSAKFSFPQYSMMIWTSASSGSGIHTLFMHRDWNTNSAWFVLGYQYHRSLVSLIHFNNFFCWVVVDTLNRNVLNYLEDVIWHCTLLEYSYQTEKYRVNYL